MVLSVIAVQFHIITLGLVEHSVIHGDFWGLPMQRQGGTGVYHSKPVFKQKGIILCHFAEGKNVNNLLLKLVEKKQKA